MVFLNKHAELLNAVINMRVTAPEKKQLKEDAAHAGLSVSELIRRRALGRRVIANTDSVVLRELRRQGGLLKHIHNQSVGAYSLDTAAALYALKNYFETLTNDCQAN